MLRRAQRDGRKFLNPVPVVVGGLSQMFKILPLYLTNKEERVPREQQGPFVTDVAVYRTAPASGLRVTWMGHSSLLVEIDGVRVLIDPVWDERAGPVRWMGPKRFFAPPLKLEDLPKIDVVLLSHDHFDHVGKGTMQRLAKLECAAGARWVTSLAVGGLLTSFGVAASRITELDWTGSVAVAGLRVTAVPARHFSGRSFSNWFETLWSSFVLKGERHTVYYGGCSIWRCMGGGSRLSGSMSWRRRKDFCCGLRSRGGLRRWWRAWRFVRAGGRGAAWSEMPEAGVQRQTQIPSGNDQQKSEPPRHHPEIRGSLYRSLRGRR